MIGRLRQLSEPRLRLQAGIEKSQTPIERDSLVRWVRKFTLYNLQFEGNQLSTEEEYHYRVEKMCAARPDTEYGIHLSSYACEK